MSDNQKIKGVVVRSTGSWYEVKKADTQIVNCRLVGKFRLEGKKVTNPLAVGDIVFFMMEPDQETGVIIEIGDRKNYVIRQSPRKKHFLHILAANIDQALLIVTIKEPKLKQGFIDRFLLMTEPYDIPVHILYNKADLYNSEDKEDFLFLQEIYDKIGYKSYLISVQDQTGIDTVREIIKGKTTLISGQSGVGKSSLLNTLNINLELRTKDLSNYTGKGQHTTTFAEMFSLDEHTHIIDSPGIKTLSYNHLEAQDVAHNFKELFGASADCKYDNCMHINEPKCAVKKAMETGEISALRYNNYRIIIDEISEQNYWERNTKY